MEAKMRRLRWDLDDWIRTHGGAINETDYDAQGELVDSFILPLLARAWADGRTTGMDDQLYGSTSDNPYKGGED